MFLTTTALAGKTNIPQNTKAVKSLKKLIAQKEYFKLESQFKLYKNTIGEKDRLYFQSYLDNAFNRNSDCVKTIDNLLKKYASQLSDSLKASLIIMQADSYFKLFQYAKSADCDSIALARYSNAMDGDIRSDVKNNIQAKNGLRSVPPQQMSIRKDEIIRWKKNFIGIMEIPIKCRSVEYDAVFDSRANISSITKTYASKLGLKILDASYDEGAGMTGIKFKVGLAVADSISIGNIVIRNVVFQVMPDSVFYIPQVKFQINMIVGFPVIEQFHEVHLYNDGRIGIPANPGKSAPHNFALDGLEPVVSLKTGTDNLNFNLDLGANTSDLYSGYYEKHKAAILKNGRKKVVNTVGAGGMVKQNVYIIPHLDLTLGNKTVIVDSVAAHPDRIKPAEKFYGNIGQDFTTKFKEIIINFKYMYIKGI